ncbi:acetyltransferase (GNAT) family domain-containing protein [Ditylenchus destructor]|uniref:Acetyltransferase (GNAT) family domain-containing protein n=1 Tax=Ditylenchus destructor TaxID=166010 RepID=A0AAD4NCU5_9BILA|nr:acetyltransferase (GNAT) family domain-containing protein [Ditylenchus destructor]
MSVTIRRATFHDLPAIVGLLSEIVPEMNANGNFQWDSRYPNATVFQMDIEHQKLWVAVVGIDHIAGFAAITTDQEPEYAEVGWDITEIAIVTHRLAVGLRWRGLGIARKFLEQAEHEARRRNIDILRIDTNSINLTMQKLVLKLCYKYAGEIGLSFRPGLRFRCYQKKLKI